MTRQTSQYVTVADAADHLQMSERTLRRWIADGRLAAWRVGERGIRVRRDDLDALVHRIPTSHIA